MAALSSPSLFRSSEWQARIRDLGMARAAALAAPQGADWLKQCRDHALPEAGSPDLSLLRRKAEHELGPMSLAHERKPEELYLWIHAYSRFQRAEGRMDRSQIERIKAWVLGAPVPCWMLPVTLRAGELVLAAGLFYEYDGAVSCHSSAMNPDPGLREYRGDALILQAMVDYAAARRSPDAAS